MATARQLRALLKSYAERDEERFYSTAMQLAAHEARLGHGNLARELRALVDRAKEMRRQPEPSRDRSRAPVPLAAPRGELEGILSASYPKTHLADMVLSSELDQKLRRVLREQRQRHKLEAHGLPPRFRLLLVGPPGSGKTMTASAVAGELSLPLFTIVLDGLITKFMGETAAKLRLVFDAIGSTRGVYLFDEFDAIGGQRKLLNDVGEIRRVLNSFLQFLEQAEPTSVIVAATNHPELLDPALFRRFDDIITYSVPSAELAQETFRNRLAGLAAPNLDWDAAVAASEQLSYADIIRACEDAAKEAILGDKGRVTTGMIVESLEERKQVPRA
jgi:SpoVK/Ycf46/Vps4 family AAA+-type ATPase